MNSPERRRVVAVIVDQSEVYQRGIVEAIRERLDVAGYGTLCIAGRDLHDQDAMIEHAARQMIHPLVRQIDVRGTILLTTVLGHGFPRADIERFARRLGEDGPVVSLGVVLPGVPSVTLDGAAALEALMAHMTADPERRRFVFIRGFVDDEDTRDREAAFRRALARRGLPVDEQLVLDGRYRSADAFAAIDALLRAGTRFDAVIAANDDMAASAVTALDRHGLSVPDDVIVSGFDDAAVAIEIQPPLTTVRARVEDQARAAAALLLEALESECPLDPDAHVGITARFVPRDSSRGGAHNEVEDDALDRALAASCDREALGSLLCERLDAQRAPAGIDTAALVAAFLGTLLDGSEDFVRLFGRHSALEPVGADGVRWWRHAARQIDRVLCRLPAGLAHPAATAPLTRALGAMAGVRRAARVVSGFERLARRQLQEILLSRLTACPSTDVLWSRLGDGLGALGVERAWVVLDETAESSRDGRETIASDGNVRLAFALDPSSSIVGTRFRRRDILPPALGNELEHGMLVLSPLVAGELQLGYLLVDCRSAMLELPAIGTNIALALRQVRQVDALERRAEALRLANVTLTEVARRDSLTGLPNRAQFHENLERALGDARDDGHDVALLFLDLDGFKLINDTLGHGAGDQLLRLVASRISSVLRPGTSLARLGGDEFTIIAPEASREDAEIRIADDVLAAIARPFRLGERVVNVTTSIGIARFPADGVDLETLVRNADTAMYHAKACGKSRHARYTTELNREALSELELREAIRRGLDAEEFHMHFQPRISLGDGRLTGFEALLRWKRPDGVETGPSRFVPVAERCGLIAELDAFSLDASCRQASRWAAAGTAVMVSVNLSVKRLQEPDIVEQVIEALARHRLDPALLELEITESAAMTDVEGNIVKLGALRALGVRIAIDDFGTGHSSLNYLRRLPVSSLKVDRSFLSGIGPGASAASADDRAADATIVRAIIALGRNLGFRVVAEGVENDAQVELLLELGCDEGQGYRFGRPLDAEMATHYILEDRAVVPMRREHRR